MSLADETLVPPFALPSNRVWAKGLFGGSHKWFKARVLADVKTLAQTWRRETFDHHDDKEKLELYEELVEEALPSFVVDYLKTRSQARGLEVDVPNAGREARGPLGLARAHGPAPAGAASGRSAGTRRG